MILLVLFLLLFGDACDVASQSSLPPGGFLENQGVSLRSRMTTSTINTFIPAGRGAFTFPAPYNTKGYRITIPSDCPGNTDCVNYVGYPYWLRMNNHTNDPVIYILIGLSVLQGGPGLTLYTLDKTTGVVTKVGNLFPPSTTEQTFTGEWWYFSYNLPTKLYFDSGRTVQQYDILTQVRSTVVDILNRNYTKSDGTSASLGCTTVNGCPLRLEQSHTNLSDTVFAGTLTSTSTNAKLGCWVYMVSTNLFRFYPLAGSFFDECNIDKSGQYTVSLEGFGTPNDAVGNRIFDNTTGVELLRKLGPSGTLGHMDLGWKYAFGVDNNGPVPVVPPNYNSTTLYQLASASTNTLIHFNHDTNTEMMLYPSHTNGKSTATVPFANQYFCGSHADTFAHANELVCASVDGAVTPLRQLIVAPLMTDINATGGNWQQTGDYDVQPKGMLDVTGRYFLWTTNLGGSRLDAFIVEVPSHLLSDTSGPSPPEGLELAGF